MATKGPSYLYGNSKGAPSLHINYPYVKPDFIGRNKKEHMEKHFSDFNVDNEYDYLSEAIHFGNDIDRVNYYSFVDKFGTTYKYDKLTNSLLLVSKDGKIITYFKPKFRNGPNKGKLNWNYFYKQRRLKTDYARIFGKQ